MLVEGDIEAVGINVEVWRQAVGTLCSAAERAEIAGGRDRRSSRVVVRIGPGRRGRLADMVRVERVRDDGRRIRKISPPDLTLRHKQENLAGHHSSEFRVEAVGCDADEDFAGRYRCQPTWGSRRQRAAFAQDLGRAVGESLMYLARWLGIWSRPAFGQRTAA